MLSQLLLTRLMDSSSHRTTSSKHLEKCTIHSDGGTCSSRMCHFTHKLFTQSAARYRSLYKSRSLLKATGVCIVSIVQEQTPKIGLQGSTNTLECHCYAQVVSDGDNSIHGVFGVMENNSFYFDCVVRAQHRHPGSDGTVGKSCPPECL